MIMPDTEKGLRQIVRETLGSEVGFTGNQFWMAIAAVAVAGKYFSTQGLSYLQIVGFVFAAVGMNVWLNMIYEVVSE